MDASNPGGEGFQKDSGAQSSLGVFTAKKILMLRSEKTGLPARF